MINYLSDYRTQDKMRGVHYYPKGLLCWFETNQYGDPTGSVYVVKSVPDTALLEMPRKQRGYQRMLKDQTKKLQVKELFSRERADTELMSVVKPKLHKYMKGEK